MLTPCSPKLLFKLLLVFSFGIPTSKTAPIAQVGNVASRLRDGMECLIDPDKPYFDVWIQLHDVDDAIYLEDMIDQEYGARPLYYAALRGFHELVEHLIIKNPQSAGARGGSYGTALHSASFAGHLQVVRSLLRHGVGVDARDYANRTPLRLASQSGHRDVVRCLIDHGADADSQEDDHNTPLNWAAHGGYVDVVRVLLEHNADANSQDNSGRTPLHDTLWGDNPKGDYLQVARLLLEHGANTNARDAFHRTPLHLVTTSKFEIRRILLEYGADVDAKDWEGRTPLQVALVEGQSYGRAQTS